MPKHLKSKKDKVNIIGVEIDESYNEFSRQFESLQKEQEQLLFDYRKAVDEQKLKKLLETVQ